MAAARRSPETGSLSRPERQWRAAVCLGWPLALAAVPLLAVLGNVPLCAFRELSGRPCPLCGGTRACAALLQGDPAAAWQANPGILPLLAVAAVHTGALGWEAWSGRRVAAPRRWSRAWTGAGVILAAAWCLRLVNLA